MNDQESADAGAMSTMATMTMGTIDSSSMESMDSMDHSNMANMMDQTNSDSMVSMDHSGMASMGHGSHFYFDQMRGPILFKSWHPETTGQLVGACFAVAFMTTFLFLRGTLL